jgi:RimJ/RimL family protein N-acetyltransferase
MTAAPPKPTIPTLAELRTELETQRLMLRPFRDADVDAIWPIVSDPAFPQLMSWSAHRDRAETLAFIRSHATSLANNEGVVWAIEHAGQVIGCIGLEGIEFQVRAWRVDRAELGYWLAPAHARQGLMTEAAHAVVRFGFETIGLHKVTVGCFAQNIASRRVIEKLGFRFIGRLEDDVWRDAAWHSHLRYELTSGEWPDVHTTMRVSRPRPT